jgi:quinol monooxygenase YgiN
MRKSCVEKNYSLRIIRTFTFVLIVVVCFIALSQLVWTQDGGSKASVRSEAQQDMPDWVRRGIPGKEHAALEPLIGTWRQHKTIYGGTMGRGLDAPPIVSEDITTRREWVADRHYMEDLTEGKIEGKPYWRKGWLGYSIMDRRYEWVTIDSLNTTMMRYLGKPGSGGKMPITMTGVFTDQGVVSEKTVGKSVGQRTVIRIENNDRHVFELYFTPPKEKELLVDRTVYTRLKKIVLPKLPEPLPGETGPYCVIAKHRAIPGRADAYEKRMLADLAKTRAEPEALQFHIHRDRLDRNLFVVYEVWRDAAALREHFEMPYVKQFVSDSAEYVDGNMEVQWLIMASEYSTGR